MIDDHKSHWQIDKRIPMALLLTLFLQIAAALVWATQLDARVNILETQTNGITSFGEKFARLEERIKNMKEDTETIKHQLEQLTTRYIK